MSEANKKTLVNERRNTFIDVLLKNVPVAEQKQTEKRASGNGNRNPEIMDRKMEPGIANVYKYC